MLRSFIILILILLSEIQTVCAQEFKTLTAIRGTYFIFNRDEDSLQIKALKNPASHQLLFFFFAAEEDPIGLDPGLSTDGRWRAINIINIFKELDPNSLFSTTFRRNILTLQPYSDSRNLEIQFYDQADLEALVNKIGKMKAEDAIIMVHRESVSKLIESLSGVPFTYTLENSCSDRIFVLERPMNGQAVLHSFRYDIR